MLLSILTAAFDSTFDSTFEHTGHVTGVSGVAEKQQVPTHWRIVRVGAQVRTSHIAILPCPGHATVL